MEEAEEVGGHGRGEDYGQGWGGEQVLIATALTMVIKLTKRIYVCPSSRGYC